MRGSLLRLVLLAAIAACAPSPIATRLATPADLRGPSNTPVASAPATAAQDANAPPRTTPGAIPSGYRIIVPRLRIDLPIAEGDVQRDVGDEDTPEGYAFHLPGTALPGENGNTFLYAHARRGMFLALWSALPGDEVDIQGPDGRLRTYVVSDVLPRVVATDVSSTLPTGRERLTLQTSTGPSPSDPRFVVFALPRR